MSNTVLNKIILIAGISFTTFFAADSFACGSLTCENNAQELVVCSVDSATPTSKVNGTTTEGAVFCHPDDSTCESKPFPTSMTSEQCSAAKGTVVLTLKKRF